MRAYLLPPVSRQEQWQKLWLREQAERALRLARESTDPMLRKQLEAGAAEFTQRADAQDKLNALGLDPDE